MQRCHDSTSAIGRFLSGGRQTFHHLSSSAKLGLDADAVIHRGLNSLLAAQIAFSGLH